MKRSKIYPNDVLLEIVGATIGKTGLVTDDYPEYNSNQAIAIVRPSNRQLAYYLSLTQETELCQLQIERLKGGGSRDNLDLHEAKILKIPKPTNQLLDYCVKVISKVRDLLKESKTLYMQAENLLLEELGLKDFKPEEELSYIVNLSDVKSVRRADAEYFQPKYERLIKNLGKDKQNLKLIARRKTKKAEILAENDYNYIEISDVDVGSGEVTFNIVKGSNLPANAKMKIEGGELIVSKVRPTRGAVGIIPDDCDESFVASGAFSIFEVVSPTREYLQVMLRSIVGELQLEKPTTGTSYPTVTDEDIEELIIPILSKSVQQKIADLVRQSQQARKKAKELLERAKEK